MNKGFTLIELLIVIAIIAVLSSMAMITYSRYREKSFVAARALPIADGCSKEIVAYCIGLNVSSATTIDVSSAPLNNCQNISLSEYNLTVNVTGSFVCNPGGMVSSGTVEAVIDTVANYKAQCVFTAEGIECSVVDR